jgi:uroporphyrinogen decarboxylase
MEKLADALSAYLLAQVRAGAQAVQLFDSWVGALSPQDYTRYVQPYSTKVLQAVEQTGVPVIHFGTGTATLLELMQQAGGSVIGLDWRVPLDQGWTRLGEGVATCSFEPAGGPGTSSTWGTASCQARRSRTCAPWSIWSTS